MGERLCVSIRHDDGREPLVVTYHWGAYTVPAFEALRQLTAILSDESSMGTADPSRLSDDVLAFRVAEAMHDQGGGIDAADGNVAAFRDLRARLGSVVADPSTLLGNRNDGLVTIGTANISRIRSWCEGEASICLESRTASNDCVWSYPTRDEISDMLVDAGYSDDEVADMFSQVGKVPACDNVAWADLARVEAAYEAAVSQYVEFPDGSYGELIEG